MAIIAILLEKISLQNSLRVELKYMQTWIRNLEISFEQLRVASKNTPKRYEKNSYSCSCCLMNFFN